MGFKGMFRPRNGTDQPNVNSKTNDGRPMGDGLEYN